MGISLLWYGKKSEQASRAREVARHLTDRTPETPGVLGLEEAVTANALEGLWWDPGLLLLKSNS